MPIALNCPDVTQMSQLLVGKLPVAEMESLLQHLETCDDCASRIGTIPNNDRLVELVRQAKSTGDAPFKDKIDQLILTLSKKLPAPTVPPGEEKTLLPSVADSFLTFTCSQCGKPLKVKANLAGKKVKCPLCQAVVEVRDVAADRTVPPPAPAVSGQTHSSITSNSDTVPPEQKPADREFLEFLSPPQAEGELGRLGNYRVLKVLGAGGMGVVFKAEDPQLKRLVALKAMLPGLGSSDSARKRFLREAQTAAAVKHDHIVTIHQVGEDRGAPFLAMEFLQGESLEDCLKREGKLPLADVLRIGREMADGLGAAHEHGLIHRDVKPANVWLETRGHKRPAGEPGKPTSGTLAAANYRVKILDFGLARAASEEQNLTQSGAIMGTPAYMAPEQAKSMPVDQRCDLFSLGVVLYRLCTGVMPYKGLDMISTLMAVATEDPPEPSTIDPTVPRALSDLVMQLLAKDPAERPVSARAVADRLQALEQQAPAERGRAPGPVPVRRRPRRLLPLTAAVLVILLPLGWFFGATVIRIATNQGELIIDNNDPNVEVTVKAGSAVVHDKVKDRRFVLTAGEYDVEVREEGDGGLRFATRKFTITRGGRETFHARLEPALAKLPDVKKDPAKVQDVKKDDVKEVPVKPREKDPVPTKDPVLTKGPSYAGKAMGGEALVQNPEPLKGVATWTVMPRLPHYLPNQGYLKQTFAFSPDGRWLASGEGYGHADSLSGFSAKWYGESQVRLWDIDKGLLAKVFLFPDKAITKVGFSHDGKLLAISHQYKGSSVTVLEIATGREAAFLESTANFCWSPREMKLLTATTPVGKEQTQEIGVHSFAQGKLAAYAVLFEDHRIGELGWSPDGTMFAISKHVDNKTGNVRVWDVAAGKEIAAATTSVPWISKLAWSADSKLLAFADAVSPTFTPSKGQKTEVHVLDVKQNKIVHSVETYNIELLLTAKNLAAPPGSPSLLTAKQVAPNAFLSWIVYYTRYEFKGAEAYEDVAPVTFSGDATRHVQAVYPLKIRDTLTGKVLKELAGQPQRMGQCAYSPDRSLLACEVVGGERAVWKVWDFKKAALFHLCKELSTKSPEGKTELWVHFRRPPWAWSADGKLAAFTLPTGYQTTSLVVWDRETRKNLFDGMPTRLDGLNDFAWAGDKLVLAPRGSNNPQDPQKLRCFDVVNRIASHYFSETVGTQWVSCSPDGSWIAASPIDHNTGNNKIHIWDGKTFEHVKDLDIKSAWGLGLCWVPRGSVFPADKENVWPVAAGFENLFRTMPYHGLSVSTCRRFSQQSMRQRIGNFYWSLADGRPAGSVLVIDHDKWVAVSPEGHVHGTPGIENDLVYIVQTAKGQENLSAAEFAQRFGWKNDPSRVTAALPGP